MNKKLALFFITIFLGMQALSFLHMAAYGYEKHEHNGHICQIFLHVEHTKHSTPHAAVVPKIPANDVITIASPKLLIVSLHSFGVALARAPPHYS